MKAVIVACSYAVSNSGQAHAYEQREKAMKTAVRQNMNESRAMFKNLTFYHKVKTQSKHNETLWTLQNA